MERSRIAIIGAGAIGGTIAGVLADAGHDVTLCVRAGIQPLSVDIAGRRIAPRIDIRTSPDDMGEFDWVMVATKVQDTAGTFPWLRRLVGASTRLVALQNGIDHVSRFSDVVPPARILPALVHVSAELLSPGVVKHHSGRRIVVPMGPDGQTFASLFAGTVIDVALTEDFLTASWLKLFGNVAVAPITALTLSRIGVLRQPDVRELAHGLLAEARATGNAVGATISGDDLNQVLKAFDEYDPDGGSSMLYDRLAGRSLEYEHLTGALVQEADRHGVPVPLNRAVLALLRGITTNTGGSGSACAGLRLT